MKEARWNITLLLLFSVFLQTFPGISTQAGKYDHLDIITLAVHIYFHLDGSYKCCCLVLDQLVTLLVSTHYSTVSHFLSLTLVSLLL